MAVKVPTTEAIEKVTAVYLVSIGRASPEQQKLAYRTLTEPRPNRCKNITMRERHAHAVHAILRYMEGMGEPVSHNQTYPEVAEAWGCSKDTVRRDYEWFLLLSEEEQNRILAKVEKDILTGWGALFSTSD